MQMTDWLTAIGYSLCYGTIVAKMFRVFYIFRNPTLRKRVSYSSTGNPYFSTIVGHGNTVTFKLQKLQDWMLAFIVLMFIAIDVIILLVYDIHSATQGTLEAVRLSNREKIRQETGVMNLIQG